MEGMELEIRGWHVAQWCLLYPLRSRCFIQLCPCIKPWRQVVFHGRNHHRQCRTPLLSWRPRVLAHPTFNQSNIHTIESHLFVYFYLLRLFFFSLPKNKGNIAWSSVLILLLLLTVSPFFMSWLVYILSHAITWSKAKANAHCLFSRPLAASIRQTKMPLCVSTKQQQKCWPVLSPRMLPFFQHCPQHSPAWSPPNCLSVRVSGFYYIPHCCPCLIRNWMVVHFFFLFGICIIQCHISWMSQDTFQVINVKNSLL